VLQASSFAGAHDGHGGGGEQSDGEELHRTLLATGGRRWRSRVTILVPTTEPPGRGCQRGPQAAPRSSGPWTVARIPNPECRAPSPESRVPSPESRARAPNPEPRVPSPESRTPSPESRVPTEPRVPSPESRVPSPESRTRVPNPESRARVPSGSPECTSRYNRGEVPKLVECVPNVSEGRNRDNDRGYRRGHTRRCRRHTLDVDPGADTNRTVYTFVGRPTRSARRPFAWRARPPN
jgi:hypothetical protein